MRIRLTLSALPLLLLALALNARSVAAQTLRGRVLVGATTAPLASAIVQALAADGTIAGSTLSTESGFFAITPLAP